MIYPKKEEVKKLIKNNNYKRVPISYEIYSDSQTPIEVMRRLKKISNHCYMLESIEDKDKWGRYTFLGFDPLLEFTCQDGEVNIKGDFSSYKHSDLNKSDIFTTTTNNPRKYIKQIIEENKTPRLKDLPPFTGGLVGYFAYDYIKYSEPSLNLDAENQDGFKDVDLMLFDKVIVFDNFKQKIIIIINIQTENIDENYENAAIELKNIVKIIKHGKPAKIKSLKLKSDFKPSFSKEEYCNIVEKAKNYIKEGEIFQVVPSNRI